MPEAVKQYFNNLYNNLRSESVTYEELETKIERYARNATYADALWGAIVKRELTNAFKAEIGKRTIRKLPEKLVIGTIVVEFQ